MISSNKAFRILLVIVVVLFAKITFAQEYKIFDTILVSPTMVGDTLYVGYYPSPTKTFDGCEVEVLQGGPFKTWGYLIDWQKTTGTTVYFIPPKKGIYYGEFLNWWWYKSSRFCNREYYHLRDFIGEGIDSMTTVKIVYPSVVQPIDTSASLYLPSTIGGFFSMYNNLSDSSRFSNWQLVINDSAKLTFRIDTAGIELSSYIMEPFTRKRQLNFTFTTELTPAETERVFSAKLLTTVTTAGKDSVYENALLFRFPPLQPKGIYDIRAEDAITVSVSPNPAELNATLSFAHNKSEAISIELYDILGTRRMTLAHDIYSSGVHSIPIDTKDLPKGSYFVRLQSSGQVVTKKLIVQ